jgi:hypothetical protein
VILRLHYWTACAAVRLEVTLARLRPGPIPERCAGYGHRAHHTDGPLVRTNLAPDVELCRPCWRRWAATDRRPSR